MPNLIQRLLICSSFAAAAMAQPSIAPLVWTQGQPPETIRKVIREVAEGGNNGFVWESRPHPDYLGPQWWSDHGVAIDEAKKLGLDVWIFDEWMYPSGLAGGKVVAANPNFVNHVVVDRSTVVEGPAEVKPGEVPGGLAEFERVLSVVALQKGKEPVNLTGKASWTSGPGSWRIVWCVTKPVRPKAGWSMANMADVLNPEAVATYIRLTHDATYEHFKDDFGKTIKGFFTDETGLRNITSYDSLPGTPGMPMPWSPAFSAYFRKLKGYDPEPLPASLWYDLGTRGRTARFDLMDAYASCFAETFFRPQQEWCHKHGVRLIGHVVEDNHADHQLGYGPGHWFRAMEYLDMPGVDVVGYQVTPGMDAGGNYWTLGSKTVWDEEFFQFEMPAMARGAALMKPTTEIFSEPFGAYGWSEGLRQQKWIGDWHIVNGFTLLTPHAVTMKYHDPDCPPHFNRTSGNPQWRYYSNWAEYTKRLLKVVAGSEPVYDAAVLYTAESKWAGPAQTAGPAVRVLENQQASTVVLPYAVFAKEGSFESGRWVYNGQRFRAVVLPYARYAPADVMLRLAAFARAGGRVIVIDEWPSGSVDGRGDEAVKTAVGDLKRTASASVITAPELNLGRTWLVSDSPNLFVSRRRAADGEWILLHNRSLISNARGRLVEGALKGSIVRYEAERGTYVAVDAKSEFEIPPYGLWCLRITDNPPAAEQSHRFTSATSFPGEWSPGLGDWRLIAGREAYAGTLTYRATLRLADAKGPVAIDLGEVGEIAELRVNGKAAGVKIAPPYVFDVTGFVKPGENLVEVDVTNTARTMWSDAFSHGDPACGLLGPVRLLK